MGKFIVLSVFSLVCCGLLYHFAPSVANPIFHIGPVAVTGMLLGYGVFLWGGYRLTGK